MEASSMGAGVGGEERKGLDKLLDLSKDISSKMSVSFKKDTSGVAIPRQRNQSNSGWMSSMTVSSMDSHDDPFAVHRQQLLAYIKQARAANRTDEVEALEQSLRDVELAMYQQTPLSYGISPEYSTDSSSTTYWMYDCVCMYPLCMWVVIILTHFLFYLLCSLIFIVSNDGYFIHGVQWLSKC